MLQTTENKGILGTSLNLSGIAVGLEGKTNSKIGLSPGSLLPHVSIVSMRKEDIFILRLYMGLRNITQDPMVQGMRQSEIFLHILLLIKTAERKNPV